MLTSVALLMVGCGDDQDPARSETTASSSADAPRPDAAAYSIVLEGENGGLQWEAYKADTEDWACLQVIGRWVGDAGPIAGFVFDSVFDADRASCVRRSQLTEDQRFGYVKPTLQFLLSAGLNGIWGIAAPDVTRIEFVLPDQTITPTLAEGVYFMEASVGGPNVVVRVHRDGEPVLECDAGLTIDDLTVSCF